MLGIILTIGILAAVLTILIVLIQNPKGGGLASNFSAGNQLFGAKQTTEGVEKLTWIFVAVIFVVSLAASAYNKGGKTTGKEGETNTTATSKSTDPAVQDAINAKPKPVPAPAQTPATSPVPNDPNAGSAPAQTPTPVN